MLSVTDHNRMFGNSLYVYPVVSRRAGGVSVGINLNPNNACNWRCIYCQVEGLVKGSAPAIDRERLAHELAAFLHELQHGRFMEEQVPPEARRISDIAMAGNGEPTSCADFAAIVDTLVAVRDAAGLHDIPLRLITNGSFLHRADVQAGIRRMGEVGGEVWFKVDAATDADSRRINSVPMQPARVAQALGLCAQLCPTWVQTCVFKLDGEGPGEAWWQAYAGLLQTAGTAQLRGVLLYGLARESMQPEATRLTPLSAEEIELIGSRISGLGLSVKVTP